MSIITEDTKLKLEGMVDERDLSAIKEYMEQTAPKRIDIDMTGCKDVHTAVLQLLLSYKLLYGASFLFNDTTLAYRLAVDGFQSCEDAN